MPALEAGQQFQKYKILEQLGSSLSGESYAAEDSIIKRKVTLKLLHPWQQLPESARRQFFREMQAISTVSHPYLATLLDYGEHNRQVYIARRFSTAGSLLSDEGRANFKPPLPLASALRYTHQLAQALYALHHQGHLHGSLTLSNVLILRGPSQTPAPDFAPFFLSDMNIMYFVRRFGKPTSQILPITAAPEQPAKRITPASDQFALAVILYFWLTGRFPYLGTPAEIENQKLKARISPIASLNSKVSVQQEGILRRALSVAPEERYPTILAFSTALINTLPDYKPALIPQTPALNTQFQPEAAQNWKPILTTEPQPEPEKPQTEPQPVPPPLPMPQPEPTPQPQILPETEPTRPEKQPEPQPAPERAPFPKPEPDPLPFPDPEIVPQPQPETIPGPITPEQPETPPQPQMGPERLPDTPAEVVSTDRPHMVIDSPYIDKPYIVYLDKDQLTLGRAGSSDILLDKDPLTSRHHALLRQEEDGYVLIDRQSATGVQVNEDQLVENEPYLLKAGDQVIIGNYKLTFYTTEQPEEVINPRPRVNGIARAN